MNTTILTFLIFEPLAGGILGLIVGWYLGRLLLCHDLLMDENFKDASGTSTPAHRNYDENPPTP